MTPRTRPIAVVAFAVFASFVSSSCGGGSPISPVGAETITGGERFGWDQPAADAGELASFRYALYLDETRSEAANVSCDSAASGGRFACTSNLPTMSAGAHALQVAAFVIDAGALRESSRSTSVRLIKR